MLPVIFTFWQILNLLFFSLADPQILSFCIDHSCPDSVLLSSGLYLCFVQSTRLFIIDCNYTQSFEGVHFLP